MYRAYTQCKLQQWQAVLRYKYSVVVNKYLVYIRYSSKQTIQMICCPSSWCAANACSVLMVLCVCVCLIVRVWERERGGRGNQSKGTLSSVLMNTHLELSRSSAEPCVCVERRRRDMLMRWWWSGLLWKSKGPTREREQLDTRPQQFFVFFKKWHSPRRCLHVKLKDVEGFVCKSVLSCSCF